MDNVTITRIPGDLKSRQRMIERAMREWADMPHSNAGADYAWDGIRDCEDDLLILESHEGKLLGALSFFVRREDNANIYVSRIGVILENHGYGKKLMHEVSKIAAIHGQGIVALPTEAGKHLFRSIGMHPRKGGNPNQPHYEFNPGEAKSYAQGKLLKS